jgi:hypothetical protein
MPDLDSSDDNEVNPLIGLYDFLREEQKPLGAEFQKVLDENFSEIVARW